MQRYTALSMECLLLNGQRNIPWILCLHNTIQKTRRLTGQREPLLPHDCMRMENVRISFCVRIRMMNDKGGIENHLIKEDKTYPKKYIFSQEDEDFMEVTGMG